MKKNLNPFVSLLFLLAVLSVSCQLTMVTRPTRNSEVIQVVASTNLQSWLDKAATEFNQLRVKSSKDKSYFVQVSYVDAGQAITTTGQNSALNANIWIPDNYVWVEIMANQGTTTYSDDCQSIASSPLVIAMWRPLAEALGWPGRDLGWLDIGSLAADPSAWAYYSGGQYGDTLRHY